MVYSGLLLTLFILQMGKWRLGYINLPQNHQSGQWWNWNWKTGWSDLRAFDLSTVRDQRRNSNLVWKFSENINLGLSVIICNMKRWTIMTFKSFPTSKIIIYVWSFKIHHHWKKKFWSGFWERTIAMSVPVRVYACARPCVYVCTPADVFQLL